MQYDYYHIGVIGRDGMLRDLVTFALRIYPGCETIDLVRRRRGRERGETMTKATISYEGHEYTANIDGDSIAISVDGVWAGTGRWTGERIDDCAADLPEGAYAGLEAALVAHAG